MIYIQAKDGSIMAEAIKAFIQCSLPSNMSVNKIIAKRVTIKITTEDGHGGVCFPDNEPAFYLGPIDSNVFDGAFDLIDGMAEQITKEEFEALVNFNKEN